MKKLAVLFVVVSFIVAGIVSAEAEKRTYASTNKAKAGYAGDWGAGVQLGTLTGATTKYFWTTDWALDATAGYDFRDETIGIAADATYNFRDLVNVSDGSLYFYGGAGVKYTTDNSIFYLRVPLGSNYFFSSGRYDIYAEVVPSYRLTDGKGIRLEFALGGRYYF